MRLRVRGGPGFQSRVWRSGERLPAGPSIINPMTKQQKITLSAACDTPFNKLVLSQSSVCPVKVGVSVEELAENIALRTLLSFITVRPVLGDTGAETDRYSIPAGGRRFQALEMLVKQKRMNKQDDVGALHRPYRRAGRGRQPGRKRPARPCTRSTSSAPSMRYARATPKKSLPRLPSSQPASSNSG